MNIGEEVMNDFEKLATGMESGGLYSLKIEAVQVNLGLRCNNNVLIATWKHLLKEVI
jgi:hypothetical protein